MTDPDRPPWLPPAPGATPGSPPPVAYAPPGHLPPPWGDGPLGEVRPTRRMILLFVVTLGIYGYIYAYRVHDEMKRHSGRGVGGGIALLLMLLAGIAMPFVTSAEVGSLYARKGQPEPVRAWTGLWLLVPALGGYFIMMALIIAMVAAAPATSTDDGTFVAVLFGLGLLAYLICAVTGAAVWFVKTNEALNRYWLAMGAAPQR